MMAKFIRTRFHPESAVGVGLMGCTQLQVKKTTSCLIRSCTETVKCQEHISIESTHTAAGGVQFFVKPYRRHGLYTPVIPKFIVRKKTLSYVHLLATLKKMEEMADSSGGAGMSSKKQSLGTVGHLDPRRHFRQQSMTTGTNQLLCNATDDENSIGSGLVEALVFVLDPQYPQTLAEGYPR
jgi:hypothetical protein